MVLECFTLFGAHAGIILLQKAAPKENMLARACAQQHLHAKHQKIPEKSSSGPMLQDVAPGPDLRPLPGLPRGGELSAWCGIWWLCRPFTPSGQGCPPRARQDLSRVVAVDGRCWEVSPACSGSLWCLWCLLENFTGLSLTQATLGPCLAAVECVSKSVVFLGSFPARKSSLDLLTPRPGAEGVLYHQPSTRQSG